MSRVINCLLSLIVILNTAVITRKSPILRGPCRHRKDAPLETGKKPTVSLSLFCLSMLRIWTTTELF